MGLEDILKQAKVETQETPEEKAAREAAEAEANKDKVEETPEEKAARETAEAEANKDKETDEQREAREKSEFEAEVKAAGGIKAYRELKKKEREEAEAKVKADLETKAKDELAKKDKELQDFKDRQEKLKKAVSKGIKTEGRSDDDILKDYDELLIKEEADSKGETPEQLKARKDLETKELEIRKQTYKVALDTKLLELGIVKPEDRNTFIKNISLTGIDLVNTKLDNETLKVLGKIVGDRASYEKSIADKAVADYIASQGQKGKVPGASVPGDKPSGSPKTVNVMEDLINLGKKK